MNLPRSLRRASLLLGSLCLGALPLAGCGFHLVGNRPVPDGLKSVYVELIDPYHVTAPPLQTALQVRIARSGGQVKSSAEAADTVLRLSNLQEGREVLSIGPDGRAIEYRLQTRVSYSLLTSKGEVLIDPESQTVSRDYSFSAQQILPKEAEETRLRGYIQDTLAELVLLRVESALSKRQAPALTPPVEPGEPPAEPLPEVTPAVVPAAAADAASPR